MIKVDDLFKAYGNHAVLNGFSHEFEGRGITCLLGASGSGKSTLLNLIAGFDREYRGNIVVDGRNIADLSEEALCDYRKHDIGFVFQEYHLLAGYTVLENILLAAELSCQDEMQNQEWAPSLLKRLGIEDKANEKAENLSGGQKQRVAIARALAGNPKLILADEPTGALDRKTADEIMGILSEISHERPVLIITHDRKICDYADEVITIENGQCTVLKEAADKTAASCTQNGIECTVPVSLSKCALRNFRAHFKRFLGVSAAVAIAVCAVLVSLSSQNLIGENIRAFEDKNTVFAWGQIPVENTGAAEKLGAILGQSAHVERSYAQYLVPQSSISLAENDVSLPAKSFGSISSEFMNIAVMPKEGEIAITPSLAKKLADDIGSLIGQKVTFTCGDFSKQLQISGVYNGSFDDYYLDAETEQGLYKTLQTDEPPLSVAYQVKGFYDVPEVEEQLEKEGFQPITASEQVESLRETFEHLQTLFMVVSAFIAAIAIVICMTLLMKTARMRAGEMGLLMALGYQRGQIRQMLFFESLLLSAMSAFITALLLLALTVLSGTLPIHLTALQFVLGICGAILLVCLVTVASNAALLKTDPIKALQE